MKTFLLLCITPLYFTATAQVKKHLPAKPSGSPVVLHNYTDSSSYAYGMAYVKPYVNQITSINFGTYNTAISHRLNGKPSLITLEQVKLVWEHADPEKSKDQKQAPPTTLLNTATSQPLHTLYDSVGYAMGMASVKICRATALKT